MKGISKVVEQAEIRARAETYDYERARRERIRKEQEPQTQHRGPDRKPVPDDTQ